MAQSTDSNPTPDQREAPAHNTTPPNIAIQNGQSTQSHELWAGIGIAPNNQASEQKVAPATNPTLEFNHSPMEDEGDLWPAMTTTFDNLFRSVPEENKPTSLQAIEPDQLNDAEMDEVRCLFSSPLAHGFCREVDIDRTGNMAISYIAPNKITRLESRTALEQYLTKNPTFDLKPLNFCWDKVILGFKDPERETICTPDPRQRYSRPRSRSPIAPFMKSAQEDQPPPTADITDVHERTGSLPKDHGAPATETNTTATDTPPRDQSPTLAPFISRSHRLENTLKPSVNLSPDMTLTEAENWLKGFAAWFN